MTDPPNFPNSPESWPPGGHRKAERALNSASRFVERELAQYLYDAHLHLYNRLRVPRPFIAGTLVAAVYRGAEDFMRANGQDEIAEAIHEAVGAVADRFTGRDNS